MLYKVSRSSRSIKNNLAITAIDKNGKLIPKKLKIGRIDNFVDGTGGDYNMSDDHYSLSLNYPRFESQIPYDQQVLKVPNKPLGYNQTLG